MTLQARNIAYALSGKTVLDAVDVDAKAGQVTAIIGPNGSGKTSLLRAVTGEVPASGDIYLNDVPVTSKTGQRLARSRAVLPQSSNIAFDFKVEDVVHLGLLAGVHAATPAVLTDALRCVGLAGYEARSYQALSGGEQQRVQLARVLAQVWQPQLNGKPCWLFLDEPVASLDVGHQLEVVDVVRDYANRGGGVVLVMHDLNLTMMMADHVILLQQGRVLASGAPEDVLQDEVLSKAYGCQLRMGQVPQGAAGLFILPQCATRA